jgi:hypothetical protein
MAPPTPLDFSLHPFDAGRAPPGLRLGGRLERQAERIHLAWHLEGAMASLRIPPPEPVPRRLDELWTSTCFECFLAIEGERPYWEFNLSPAGHWNVYALEDYRSGLRPEPAYRALVPRLEAGERSLSLHLAFPLPPAIPAAAPLRLGITAVIEAAGGELSYWGLAHPGAEPDFHRREGFLLRL